MSICLKIRGRGYVFGVKVFDVLQFNFYDYSKLVLSSHCLFISHVDKHFKMLHWSLSDLTAQPLVFSQPGEHDPQAVKLNKLWWTEESLAIGAGLVARTAAATGSKVSLR